MRRAFFLMFFLCMMSRPLSAQQVGIYQHGTVVRMHVGDCLLERHGFMASFGGPQAPQAPESCPEYTLLSDKVVFVIVGRSSNQLIPLAEIIDFRFHNNELAVRVDDARHEAKFTIKEMVLRPEWDHTQQHMEQQMRASYSHSAEDAMAVRAGQ